MEKKLNITSTALEKGIDLAKEFLEKLILPTVEETGLLIKEQVASIRFRNQVRTLNKAKDYCLKNNISPKSISLKLLCPLLDNASLEEDDFLQDKWAILLSNLVDSESNIQNHVFPYILGQISKTEFMIIEKAYWEKVDREKKMKAEIVECKLEEESKSTLLGKELKELREKRDLYRSANEQYFHRIRRQRELEEELRKIPEKLITLEYNLKKPQSIPEDGIREFEVSNLIRLGLIRLIQEPFADGQTLEIPNKPEQPYLLVDLDIDLGSNDEHVLTELGLLFIEACSEKKCRNQ